MKAIKSIFALTLTAIASFSVGVTIILNVICPEGMQVILVPILGIPCMILTAEAAKAWQSITK